MTFRGHFSNGVVVLPNAGLPEGTLVDVTPVNDKARGASGAAILAAVEKLPKVPREWMDELEQAVAAGHRPPATPVVFPEESGRTGNG